MGLVDAVTSPLDGLVDGLLSPFNQNEKKQIIPNDFEDGFVITEILDNGSEGYKVKLKNSFAPLVPFKWGGKGRLSKEFYPGRQEPSVQVLGTEEDDLTIRGRLRERKFTEEFAGVAQEYMELLDTIRLRQNIVKLQLGEWVRYGFISSNMWEMTRKNKMKYEITFLIVGFSLPTNPVYLSDNKEIPYDINSELVEAGANFVPEDNGTPFDIIDQLNFVISDVAAGIANVTNFVDSAFDKIEDVGKAIIKAKLLIKATQNKVNNYKRKVGAIEDPKLKGVYSLDQRLAIYSYRSQSVASARNLTAILERMRERFNSIIVNIPIARHLVKEGDTLQSMAAKYYGDSDLFTKIRDNNNLGDAEPQVGSILEIPR